MTPRSTIDRHVRTDVIRFGAIVRRHLGQAASYSPAGPKPRRT